MSIFKEFREFAMRGNVVDLAVAVIIGGAFGKIVASLVADIVMPVVGLLVGGVDFTSLAYTVDKGLGGKGATIKYGMFIQSVFDFIIVALAIFAAIKVLNRFKKKEEEVAVVAPQTELLLAEIRDLLKQQVRTTP